MQLWSESCSQHNTASSEQLFQSRVHLCFGALHASSSTQRLHFMPRQSRSDSTSCLATHAACKTSTLPGLGCAPNFQKRMLNIAHTASRHHDAKPLQKSMHNNQKELMPRPASLALGTRQWHALAQPAHCNAQHEPGNPTRGASYMQAPSTKCRLVIVVVMCVQQVTHF